MVRSFPLTGRTVSPSVREPARVVVSYPPGEQTCRSAGLEIVGAMQNEIHEFERELGDASADEILSWAQDRFPGRVALASSLGLEDQALTDLIARLALDIPVFTLDTGRLFQESHELIDRTRRRYGIRIQVLSPEAVEVESMVAEYGTQLFHESIELRKLCCEVRKLHPLRRALDDLDAWVCGLRREQSVTRTDTRPVEWDEANGLVKVNPLWNWTEDRLAAYVDEHDVPINPLHARGFPSIGCAPCTRAIGENEDVRAGRWWWESPEHKECGLHAHRGDAPAPASAPGSSGSDFREDGAT